MKQAKLTARGEAVPEQPEGGMGREKDRGVVLTCLKQHQQQQQAGAHGQIASALLYAGVQPPGRPAAPRRAAR